MRVPGTLTAIDFSFFNFYDAWPGDSGVTFFPFESHVLSLCQMLITPHIFSGLSLVAAQSTRRGGLSKAPFESLNLGLSVGDDPQQVLQNRALFCEALGIGPGQLALSKQVHGSEVLVARGPQQAEGFDAIITNTPGVFAAVSVADCTPVLICDPVNKACAAIHAGWRGTVAQITLKTLLKMKKEFGTHPADCLAFIGACISFDAFEVNADVAGHFAETEKHYDAASGKFHADLKGANRRQLLEAGLASHHIEVSPLCTVLNNDLFFSHRREKGLTGRMMAVIGMK